MELPPELTHHAIRVLRLKAGSAITLFDGLGGQYGAILRIDGKAGLAEVGPHDNIDVELAGEIILVQGIAAGDKMDWIIEKSVELGASRLVPIAARRSVPQLKGTRLEKRQRHWLRVAQAASEQCGRNRLMRIDAPCSLGEYLQAHRDTPRTQILCCHPAAAAPLHTVLDHNATRISLLVGPEGGWSEAELATADRVGITPVQFGLRVLRTETAGLAMAAAATALLAW
jgi:16S rRNA (uracil1498-N3)-methyltransferase